MRIKGFLLSVQLIMIESGTIYLLKLKMLKYCMFILSKVSFDRNLFEKELNKAIAFIDVREEIIELEKWCREIFGELYLPEIDRCFS